MIRKRKLSESAGPIDELEAACDNILTALEKRGQAIQYRRDRNMMLDDWAVGRALATVEAIKVCLDAGPTAKQRERLDYHAGRAAILLSRFQSAPVGVEPVKELVSEGARAFLWAALRPEPDAFVVAANAAHARREREALLAEAAALEEEARKPQTNLARAAELRERAAAI